MNTSFWSVTISGLIGVAIGAGSMFFAQKSATTAENQYFMELDLLRISTISDNKRSFEDKLEALTLLEKANTSGFRAVFLENLKEDIEQTSTVIANITEAQQESAEKAAQALREEQSKAALAAQQSKERAITTNPAFFFECGQGTKTICP